MVVCNHKIIKLLHVKNNVIYFEMFLLCDTKLIEYYFVYGFSFGTQIERMFSHQAATHLMGILTFRLKKVKKI